METWSGKKIYFVGIKGAGLSGLAQLLKAEGAAVAGSDTAEEFPAGAVLKKAGIKTNRFDPKNISSGIDFLIYSSAYPAEHPERERARELKIPELSYAAALARYAAGKKTIVVTGTHGKTTTAAVLGQIFEAAGLDPAVLVGDIVRAWGNSIRLGSGDFFIVEGDEYQEKFRLFKPVGVVIPALDWDHPDYFPSPQAYLKSFQSWLSENSQARLAAPKEVLEKMEKIGPEVYSPEAKDGEIFRKSKFILPGEKYKSNCLVAIRFSRLFGISENNILSGIKNFKGVGRRLDYYTKEDDKILIIYDYAHHPEEIKATLAALKEKYPERALVAVFQPHTYSRTEAFLKEFAKSFSGAEEVFLEKTYASAREKKGKVSSEGLLRETKKFHKKVSSFKNFAIQKLPSRPLVIFMGAGDIWKKAKKLGKFLKTGD